MPLPGTSRDGRRVRVTRGESANGLSTGGSIADEYANVVRGHNMRNDADEAETPNEPVGVAAGYGTIPFQVSEEHTAAVEEAVAELMVEEPSLVDVLSRHPVRDRIINEAIEEVRSNAIRRAPSPVVTSRPLLDRIAEEMVGDATNTETEISETVPNVRFEADRIIPADVTAYARLDRAFEEHYAGTLPSVDGLSRPIPRRGVNAYSAYLDEAATLNTPDYTYAGYTPLNRTPVADTVQAAPNLTNEVEAGDGLYEVAVGIANSGTTTVTSVELEGNTTTSVEPERITTTIHWGNIASSTNEVRRDRPRYRTAVNHDSVAGRTEARVQYTKVSYDSESRYAPSKPEHIFEKEVYGVKCSYDILLAIRNVIIPPHQWYLSNFHGITADLLELGDNVPKYGLIPREIVTEIYNTISGCYTPGHGVCFLNTIPQREIMVVLRDELREITSIPARSLSSTDIMDIISASGIESRYLIVDTDKLAALPIYGFIIHMLRKMDGKIKSMNPEIKFLKPVKRVNVMD